MDQLNKAFWERIKSFEIDEGSPTLTFAKRLADEQEWSEGFAERVIAEYKRFLFLAAKAGHPVTPSLAVDEAWHLHLTYTVSYWERLCPEILGFRLHHHPTRGGAGEDAKHKDWYTRTLDSYSRLFNEAPPADIWPRGSGESPSILSEERSSAGISSAAKLGAAVAASAMFAGVGCSTVLGGSQGYILAAIAVAFAVAMLVVAWINGKSKRDAARKAALRKIPHSPGRKHADGSAGGCGALPFIMMGDSGVSGGTGGAERHPHQGQKEPGNEAGKDGPESPSDSPAEGGQSDGGHGGGDSGGSSGDGGGGGSGGGDGGGGSGCGGGGCGGGN